MILEHLPILQVAIPLIAAPICFLLRKPALCRGWSLFVAGLAFIVAMRLLFQVRASGVISYRIGDWPEPWGIQYVVDPVDAIVVVIVSAVGIAVLAFGRASVEKEIPTDGHCLFYTMYLLSLCGLLGMAITGDLFNLFVFLEISALSSYVLISLSRDRRALTASYNYLVMGTIGATFYVIGVGLLYQTTGTLNMIDLATLAPAIAESRTTLTALAFLTVGLCLKAAVFPLHAWMPNAYAHAPSVVACFLSATATKVSVYVLIRLFFTVFGAVEDTALRFAEDALTVMAIAGIFIGSMRAIYQKDLKRALAFSSVAQIGYMILGVGFASVAGIQASMIHLFNHALMKCALFMALGCVVFSIGSARVEDIAGIAKRMPITMAAFVVAGLSLIGVPGTVGFVSKWYLIQAALEADAWPIAGLILVSSLLAVIYVWRVVEAAYFQQAAPGHPSHDAGEAPLTMLVPMWGMVGTCVYFGLDATFTSEMARTAAEFILGNRP